MDHLYTPWRMAYIKGQRQPAQGCVFCQKVQGDDETEYVIARSEHVYATLNLFPYSNGHLLVVPYAHIATQEDLCTGALTDLMVMVNRAIGVLRQTYSPHAFNIGANLGTAAGAGIAAHYHFHIVPRWAGDNNFMAVVGNTRVIPDTLDNIYTDLHTAWKDLYEKEK